MEEQNKEVTLVGPISTGAPLAVEPCVLAETLLGAAEQDRDELADALHDGALQSLVVARYAADAAVRGGSPDVARDAVQQALVEMRRALWHLRPRGAAGLTDALQQLAAQRAEAGGALVLTGDLDAGTLLGGAAATLAFRAVQALPGPSTVALERDGDQLVVDAAGDLPSPERWAHRARALGGDLTDSAGGFRLVLPLTPARPDARTSP